MPTRYFIRDSNVEHYGRKHTVVLRIDVNGDLAQFSDEQISNALTQEMADQIARHPNARAGMLITNDPNSLFWEQYSAATNHDYGTTHICYFDAQEFRFNYKWHTMVTLGFDSVLDGNRDFRMFADAIQDFAIQSGDNGEVFYYAKYNNCPYIDQDWYLKPYWFEPCFETHGSACYHQVSPGKALLRNFEEFPPEFYERAIWAFYGTNVRSQTIDHAELSTYTRFIKKWTEGKIARKEQRVLFHPDGKIVTETKYGNRYLWSYDFDKNKMVRQKRYYLYV